MKYSLSKKGYTLRAPEPEDLDCLMDFENSAEQFAGNGEISGPYSKYQMKLYLENAKNSLYDDRQLRLMIENEEKHVVGIVDICSFDPYGNKAEIGIIISKEMRRKGIGQTALTLLEEHCFNTLDIHMLYAYISVDNISSIALFKKCGFKQCAHIKDWSKNLGKYSDVIMVQKIK